jgi:hypothetical protein
MHCPVLRLDACNGCTVHVALQGAVFLNWTRDGLDLDNLVPVQLQPDVNTFASALEAKGVGSDRPVVVRCCLLTICYLLHVAPEQRMIY